MLYGCCDRGERGQQHVRGRRRWGGLGGSQRCAEDGFFLCPFSSPWRGSWAFITGFHFDRIAAEDFGAPAFHIFTDIGGHDDAVRIDDASFFGVSEVPQISIKRTAEQSGADGISKDAALVGLVFKGRIVGPKRKRLPAGIELKGPCSSRETCFELELAGQAGADGGDAFNRLVPGALVGDQGGLKPPHWNGRFVDDIDHDQDNVFIVVVNVHPNGGQMGVQRARTGAVVVTHHRSPSRTDG